MMLGVQPDRRHVTTPKSQLLTPREGTRPQGPPVGPDTRRRRRHSYQPRAERSAALGKTPQGPMQANGLLHRAGDVSMKKKGPGG